MAKPLPPSVEQRMSSWIYRTSLITVSAIFVTTAVATDESDPKPDSSDNPKPVVLTKEALEIHRSGLLIDGHNDLAWHIRKYGDKSFDKLDISQPQPELQTDIPRLRKGGMGGQFWSVWIPADTPQDGSSKKMALEQFDIIHRMIKRYDDTFTLCLTADDVEAAHKAGKIASLIGVEGGNMIENSLDNLREYYRLGARYMSLTHTESIDWADSSTDDAHCDGLSEFGLDVVREMNRLGMLVDFSHVSFDCMRNALEVTQAPPIASHSGAYGVAKHVRNIPDDVIRDMAKKGGVVMVVFFPGYIHPKGAVEMSGYWSRQRELKKAYPDQEAYDVAWKAYRDKHPIPNGGVQTVVDHIDYIVKIAGIDHVGLGGDYEGVSQLPNQLEDVTGYPLITQELLNRGYSAEDIHKVMGGNILRALREAEQVAKKLQAK